MPISYGYADGQLYFAFFHFGEEPRKEAHTETTRTAWSPDLSTVGPRRQMVGTYVLPMEESTGMKGKAYA